MHFSYQNSLAHFRNAKSFPFGRKNAEEALQGLNGKVIGNQTVRLSWGRHPSSKQVSLGSITWFLS